MLVSDDDDDELDDGESDDNKYNNKDASWNDVNGAESRRLKDKICMYQTLTRKGTSSFGSKFL